MQTSKTEHFQRLFQQAVEPALLAVARRAAVTEAIRLKTVPGELRQQATKAALDSLSEGNSAHRAIEAGRAVLKTSKQ